MWPFATTSVQRFKWTRFLGLEKCYPRCWNNREVPKRAVLVLRIPFSYSPRSHCYDYFVHLITLSVINCLLSIDLRTEFCVLAVGISIFTRIWSCLNCQANAITCWWKYLFQFANSISLSHLSLIVQCCQMSTIMYLLQTNYCTCRMDSI